MGGRLNHDFLDTKDENSPNQLPTATNISHPNSSFWPSNTTNCFSSVGHSGPVPSYQFPRFKSLAYYGRKHRLLITPLPNVIFNTWCMLLLLRCKLVPPSTIVGRCKTPACNISFKAVYMFVLLYESPPVVTWLTVYRRLQVLLQAVLAIFISRDFLAHFRARIDNCGHTCTNFYSYSISLYIRSMRIFWRGSSVRL